jgi:Cu2+-exporting ATPase
MSLIAFATITSALTFFGVKKLKKSKKDKKIVEKISQKLEQVFVQIDDLTEKATTKVSSAYAEGQTSLHNKLKQQAYMSDGDTSEPSNTEKINKVPIPVSLSKLDKTWQEFMRGKIDPLLGKKREQQRKELVASEEGLKISDSEKRLNRYIGISTVALGTATAGYLFFPPLILASVFAIVYLTMPIYKSAYRSLTKEGRVKLDLTGALYITGTWLSGHVIIGALGELFYYLNDKLILVTQDRSHNALINVFGQQPRFVWVLVNGTEIEIPLEQLRAGDTIVVNTGQTIPVDGSIIDGMASIDQHQLTGESQPAEKVRGDSVFASTVVLAGKIYVKVEKTGPETVTAKIGTILNNTTSYQMTLESKGLQMAHQSALPMLLLSGLALPTVGTSGAVAILMGNFGLNLKATAPVAMLNFLKVASEKGILVKDGRSLELLNKVDTVLFDKTGTLTLEQPQVARIYACHHSINEEQLLTYAAAAEGRHSHPIAKSILAAATERQLELPEIEDAQYEIGYGIKVKISNELIRVGSNRFMVSEGISIPDEIQKLQTDCHEQGHSIIMVAVGEQLAGAIELQPTIRPEAKRIIHELQQRNLSMYIISGDQEQPTRKLAQELGIEHYFANTLPENKAALVEQLQQEGRSVCFVGDGINDAIALKKANVSVSLSGATTAATDTAQVVFMDGSINQLTQLFTFAHEFDTNMKTGFAAAIVPSATVIGGVFFFHFGIATALAVHILGLTSNMGIAMMPLKKNNTDEPQQK